MPATHVNFIEATLPWPEYERLLTLIFGGDAAITNAPAGLPFAAGVAGALDFTRADAGASRAKPAEGVPFVPARPGPANTPAEAS